jgi:hypothetical protein
LTPTEPVLRCHFCDTGFVRNDRFFKPCRVTYHPRCFRIGAPFTSRLDDDKGLTIPIEVASYHGFICESCGVRATVDCELNRTAIDTACLMLEHATMVDIYNHWSVGTLKAYKSKHNVIKDFERDFALLVLQRPCFLCPPSSQSRPLMWAQERYSLYPAR